MLLNKSTGKNYYKEKKSEVLKNAELLYERQKLILNAFKNGILNLSDTRDKKWL